MLPRRFLGKQVPAALREAYERTALMQLEPTAFDRQIMRSRHGQQDFWSRGKAALS